MKCIKCKKEINPNDIWCPYCGEEQNQKFNLYVLLLILFIFSFILIFFCYLYKENKILKEYSTYNTSYILE